MVGSEGSPPSPKEGVIAGRSEVEEVPRPSWLDGVNFPRGTENSALEVSGGGLRTELESVSRIGSRDIF